MSDWWRAVEEALARRELESPDPWAGAQIDAPLDGLTDEQRRFLEQLADTPHARLDDD